MLDPEQLRHLFQHPEEGEQGVLHHHMRSQAQQSPYVMETKEHHIVDLLCFVVRRVPVWVRRGPRAGPVHRHHVGAWEREVVHVRGTRQLSVPERGVLGDIMGWVNPDVISDGLPAGLLPARREACASRLRYPREDLNELLALQWFPLQGLRQGVRPHSRFVPEIMSGTTVLLHLVRQPPHEDAVLAEPSCRHQGVLPRPPLRETQRSEVRGLRVYVERVVLVLVTVVTEATRARQLAISNRSDNVASFSRIAEH